MNLVTNILMVGVGGQGTVLSSDMLSLAAMYDGNDVKKSEIHGMSQRGGSVFSHIRYGEKVYSPVIPEGEADILLSLEEMETLRWLEYLKPAGSIVCLRENILPANAVAYPVGTADFLKSNYKHVYFAEPQSLKSALGNTKVMNVALLGMLSKLLNISGDAWHRAITELAPRGTQEVNLKAFTAGQELM